MIKTVTEVKKTKKALEQIEELINSKKSIEADVATQGQEFMKVYAEYKEIDPMYRHNSAEFENIYNIRDSIADLRNRLNYIDVLQSNVIYANVSHYVDTHAYEVIKMKNIKHLTIRRLKVDLINPEELAESINEGTINSSIQQWSYEVDPDGKELEIEQRKDGVWYVVNTEKTLKLSKEPKEFYDFNS